MKIAIQGLGRMGMQISKKLSENGHEVIVLNRNQDKVAEAVSNGAIAARDKPEAVSSFNDARVIVWLMLPADIVDVQAAEWLELLPKGSIIVDGGNSDFRDTKRLNEKVSSANLHLVDIGVSGGVWGYQNGCL